MVTELNNLLARLNDPELRNTTVIDWGSPVPCFGNILSSKIATVGINPSNLEFVGTDGQELNGVMRRFHTLKSLQLKNWNDVKEPHLQLILDACLDYFNRNPYDRWFKKLDYIISGSS